MELDREDLLSVDVDGSERATLRFRDLDTGTDLPDDVRDVYYGLVWANDDRTLFYVRTDDAVRPYQVWRHTLGTAVTDDVLVFQEDDERFYVSIHPTRTRRFFVITAESKVTTEVHLLDADDPEQSPRLVTPREHGTEYHVEHHVDALGRDSLYVVTNADGAENFKLMRGALDSGDPDEWTEVLAHRDDVRLGDVDAFAGASASPSNFLEATWLRSTAARGANKRCSAARISGFRWSIPRDEI